MDRISSHSRVYIDTNVIIYLVEANDDFYNQVRMIFEIIQNADAKILTSEMTKSECLDKPLRNNDSALVANYHRFFANSGLDFLVHTVAQSNRAAHEAERLKLQLNDAIHYLSALEAGCNYFITSDKTFKSGPKMTVIQIKK